MIRIHFFCFFLFIKNIYTQINIIIIVIFMENQRNNVIMIQFKLFISIAYDINLTLLTYLYFYKMLNGNFSFCMPPINILLEIIYTYLYTNIFPLQLVLYKTAPHFSNYLYRFGILFKYQY